MSRYYTRPSQWNTPINVFDEEAQEVKFSKIIDGQQRTYEPCNYDILTYFIPRVHTSVTKEVMMNILTEFFDDTTANEFDCNGINRIDFVPIAGNDNFKKAFVYHHQMSIRDKRSHFKRLTHMQNIWNGTGHTTKRMNIVNRITSCIFAYEEDKHPIKVHFTHNDRQNFWYLLPNRNPMSEYQEELVEKIHHAHQELVDELDFLCQQDVPIPQDFDESILNNSKFDNAWTCLGVSTTQMQERLNQIENEHLKLNQQATKHHKLSLLDLDAMEDLELQPEQPLPQQPEQPQKSEQQIRNDTTSCIKQTTQPNALRVYMNSSQLSDRYSKRLQWTKEHIRPEHTILVENFEYLVKVAKHINMRHLDLCVGDVGLSLKGERLGKYISITCIPDYKNVVEIAIKTEYSATEKRYKYKYDKISYTEDDTEDLDNWMKENK